jgi:hypothetical protein
MLGVSSVGAPCCYSAGTLKLSFIAERSQSIVNESAHFVKALREPRLVQPRRMALRMSQNRIALLRKPRVRLGTTRSSVPGRG